MAATSEHAVLLGIERIYVAGAAKGLGRGRRIGQCLDGLCPVMGGDTCRTSFKFIDGHGEGRTQHAGIILYLVWQVEFLTALDGYGGAEHATSVLQHEVHFLRSNHFCGHDEVTFVLSVLIVNHDDELPCLEVFNGFFYSI